MRKLVRAYLRHRFGWLFLTLMLAIGVSPVIKAVSPGLNLLGPLMALSLVAAIGSVARERVFRMLIALGVLVVALGALRAAVGGETMAVLGQAVGVLMFLLATLATARHALRAGEVDDERIFAALDTYLMAGLLFGASFSTLEQIWPDSFRSPTAIDLDLQGAVYFSFVTIATLGYGDIVPVGGPARGLVILEAVSGQMYLAVLVARLVSLYSMRAKK